MTEAELAEFDARIAPLGLLAAEGYTVGFRSRDAVHLPLGTHNQRGADR